MNAIRLSAMALLVLGCASTPGAFCDSLWPAAGGSLFSDHKAYRVGDVVTVIVDESSEVSNAAGSTLSKASDTEGELTTLDFPVKNGAAKIFSGDKPKVQWSGKRSFDGKGDYSLEDSMKTRLTAIVIEVLPNGNLVIEGSRLRQSAREKVKVRLSGIVRPEDISADNTVSSSAVAEGKIVFDSSGPVARSSRRGLLNRLIDFVWPF